MGFICIALYKTTLELYDKRGAILTTMIAVTCPLFFNLSLLSLSEIPFMLLLSISILFLVRGLKYANQEKYFGLAGGFALALSSGFRLEAWIILALFIGMILLTRRWKFAAWFFISGVSYPLFWMFTCFLSQGDPLYSIHGSSEWNITVAGINQNVDQLTLAIRLIIQPIILNFNLTPWFIVMTMVSVLVLWRKRKIGLHHLIWAIPIFALLGVYEYKTYLGDLNTHPRYSSTILILAIPHLGALSLVFKRKWLEYLFVFTSILIFIFSFHYKSTLFEEVFRPHELLYKAGLNIRHYLLHGQEAVPQIEYENAERYADVIKKEIREGDGLIVDFIAWDVNAYIMLQSGLQSRSFHTSMENVLLNMREGDLNFIAGLINRRPEGVIVLRKNSPKWKYSSWLKNENRLIMDDRISLLVDLKFEDSEILVFRYKNLNSVE